MLVKHMPRMYLHRNMEVYPNSLGKASPRGGEREREREREICELEFQTVSHYNLN